MKILRKKILIRKCVLVIVPGKMEMTTTFWVILFVLLMLFQLIGLIIMKLNCSFILKLYAFFWPNKRNLQNKTVWLIGGSSGIGKELALQLAKLNCRLALTSTNQTKLDEVRQLCLGRTKIQPEEILALACDIRVQDQCNATFGRIVGRQTESILNSLSLQIL